MVRKIYLHLVSSFSILGLSIQGALAEADQPSIHEWLINAEAVSLATDNDTNVTKFSPDGESFPKTILASTLSRNLVTLEPDTFITVEGQCFNSNFSLSSCRSTPLFPAVTAQAGSPKAEVETELMSTSMDSVTSVSQLADVQPTDWAFQALQSLIERYGCIAGYPNNTYRGNQALSRYEFAAGLNACLMRVSELIATATADLELKEDWVTLQALQTEFSAELATLRSRVDTLEAKNAEIEANQFTTTTRLTGQVIWALSAGGFSGDRIISPRGAVLADDNPNVSSLYRATVSLNTSFNGTDLLNIRLNTGSDRARDHATGILEPSFGSFLEFSLAGTNDDLSIARLYYTFTPFPDITVSVGTVIAAFDFIDRNRYANLSFRDFSTLALVNNYLLLPLPAGSGAFVDWNPGQGPFKLRALYLAADAGNPSQIGNSMAAPRPVSPFIALLYPGGSGNNGLFGDPNQGIVELEYAPTRSMAIRLQYTTGQVFDGQFDVFGVNFEMGLNKKLAVFGRYGYGSYNDTAYGDIRPNYWMAGVYFPDLFVQSAFAGVAVGQPFIENAVGNTTQTNIEAFYNFPATNNIRITPLVQVIIDPANQSSNGTIFTGTLRTVLSF